MNRQLISEICFIGASLCIIAIGLILINPVTDTGLTNMTGCINIENALGWC